MSYSVQDRQALEQCTSFELESTDIEVNPGMYSFLLYRALQTVALSIYAGFRKLWQMHGDWEVLS